MPRGVRSETRRRAEYDQSQPTRPFTLALIVSYAYLRLGPQKQHAARQILRSTTRAAMRGCNPWPFQSDAFRHQAVGVGIAQRIRSMKPFPALLLP